jgi:hypothetical protein
MNRAAGAPVNMICHYTKNTFRNVAEVRPARTGKIAKTSEVFFDVAEILSKSEYVELENAGETILSWGRDKDKTAGVLNRMYCGAQMVATDICLAEDEVIISLKFGMLLEPYLGYPKWNAFCVRVTNKVEELIMYYGAYVNLDVDYSVQLSCNGL